MSKKLLVKNGRLVVAGERLVVAAPSMDCPCCDDGPSYTLKDCANVEDDIVTDSDLSQFIGEIVLWEDTCWEVQQWDPNHDPSEPIVEIDPDEDFETCAECFCRDFECPDVETYVLKAGFTSVGGLYMGDSTDPLDWIVGGEMELLADIVLTKVSGQCKWVYDNTTNPDTTTTIKTRSDGRPSFDDTYILFAQLQQNPVTCEWEIDIFDAETDSEAYTMAMTKPADSDPDGSWSSMSDCIYDSDFDETLCPPQYSGEVEGTP